MLKQKITKNEVRYFAVYIRDAKLQIACQDVNIPCFADMKRRLKYFGGVADFKSIAETFMSDSSVMNTVCSGEIWNDRV